MKDAGHCSLIADQATLSETYIPKRLYNRGIQIRQMLRCFSPALKKRRPVHLWLHGKPGTGKTATALYALRHLKERANVEGLLINCWQKDTFFEILDEMVWRLRILRAEEHRTSLKLQKIGRHLAGRPFVVVLDEIDRLKPAERSTALYSLDALDNVGLVCISNSRSPFFEVEERVRSRVNPYWVEFPAYSAGVLVQILNNRAAMSLAGGAYSQKLLKRTARHASGDARVAIRSLKVSAELAENEQLDAICGAGLCRQRKELQAGRKEHILNTLTEDHRMLYRIVKQKGRILSGDLWQEYLRHCRKVKRKPLAPRTFSEYANRLVQAGLITSERARVRGKVRLFKARG